MLPVNSRNKHKKNAGFDLVSTLVASSCVVPSRRGERNISVCLFYGDFPEASSCGQCLNIQTMVTGNPPLHAPQSSRLAHGWIFWLLSGSVRDENPGTWAVITLLHEPVDSVHILQRQRMVPDL